MQILDSEIQIRLIDETGRFASGENSALTFGCCDDALIDAYSRSGTVQ